VPGGGCAGGLSCGFLAPMVTVPVVLPYLLAPRVTHSTAGLRSRLVADASGRLRSSATRDRSAGRARQGRSSPEDGLQTQ
jgi:hypothetical protein